MKNFWLHRVDIMAMTVLMLLAAFESGAAAAELHAAPEDSRKWQEGVHYVRLESAKSRGGEAKSIEVMEFFGYWCPHCRALQPHLKSWCDSNPQDVAVVPVPVVWNQGYSRTQATLYYTLLQLGRLDLHESVFERTGDFKKLGLPRMNTFEAQRDFAVGHGIPVDQFTAAYRSEPVTKAVDRAYAMTRAYKIEETPTMVVNETYVTGASRVSGGYTEMLSLVDALVNEARQARRKL